MEQWPVWLFDPSFLWFIVGLVFLLTELALPGLVIFFFGVGAWLVSILMFVADMSFTLQLFIFLSSSVLCLAVFRKRLKMLLFNKDMQYLNLEDSLDDFTGKKALVTREIRPNVKGKVEFHGTNWDAESDLLIPSGTMVTIVEKNNITLKVKPL